MKKTLKFICVVLVIFIGCMETELESPGVPWVPGLSAIELRCEERIQWFEDVEKNLSILVIALNAHGVTVEGVTVELTLTGAEGLISPSEAVTDENGKVEAVVTIKPSLGESTASIIVKAGNITASKTMNITGLKRPATMHVHTSTPVLKVIPDQNSKFELGVTLTDENGNGVPNVHLIFSLHPADPDIEIYGTITQTSPVEAVFNTLGGGGKVIIVCEVEELIGTEYALSDSIMITVYFIGHSPMLDLSATTNNLRLPPDSVGHTTLTATYCDLDGLGVLDQQIDFTCQYGNLTKSSEYTNSNGQAFTEYYIQPNTDFPDYTNEIEDPIKAIVHDTSQTDSTSIHVEIIDSDAG